MKYAIILFCILGAAVLIERLTIPDTTAHMLVAAKEYGQAARLETPPSSFRYDGCTLFPNKIFFTDLNQACLQHDIAYWYGGTTAERKEADLRLKQDIAAAGILGQIMQYPVYMSVRLFGDSFLTRVFNAHWGFGWD